MTFRLLLGDDNDDNNVSMTCNSKIDHFLHNGGNILGNDFVNGIVVKPDTRGAKNLSMNGLSYSDPEGLNSPTQDIGDELVIKRHLTWHKNWAKGKYNQRITYPTNHVKEHDIETPVVIGQITSTV